MNVEVKIMIVFLAFLCLTGCNNSDSHSDIEVTTQSTFMTNSTIDATVENNMDYEREAVEVIKNNDYSTYDLGYISIDLPWIDRRYPQNQENPTMFYCNQGNYNFDEPPEQNAIFISITESKQSYLSDSFFDERELYSEETVKTENIPKAKYYNYRSWKLDENLNPDIYYDTHNYIFRVDEKQLYSLEIRIPEDWSIDGRQMCERIFESVKLSKLLYTQNDFFSSKDNREKFTLYREHGEYSELYSLIESHLAQKGIESNDSALKIKELLEKIKPYFEDININYDDIEEKGIITYKTINELSPAVHLVPIGYTTTSGVDAKFGIKENDWLFFDEIIIKGDNSDWSYSPKSYNINRDIIENGMIEESILIHISPDELIDISNNDKAIIRFKNVKEDKYLDYSLSSEELIAAKAIATFNSVNIELSNLIFAYEQHMIIE